MHFLTPRGVRAFEQQMRAEGRHGAYAQSWAMRTRTQETAELVVRALLHRARS